MYGGIYTDIDNSPTGFNGETIEAKDDSFFLTEQVGILSQYFLASSFGHPLMAKILGSGIQQLKRTKNVMVNYPAQNTGPGNYMYLLHIVLDK
jgi:mannosyltransferase OCH1-like enzyme